MHSNGRLRSRVPFDVSRHLFLFLVQHILENYLLIITLLLFRYLNLNIRVIIFSYVLDRIDIFIVYLCTYNMHTDNVSCRET